MRSSRVPIFALAAAIWMVAGPGSANAAQVSCGSTITADTTLRSDLSNCPGDGLTIGADNITLDLGGHTIDGDAVAGTADADAGVQLTGHHGVKLQNGTVQEFGTGVLLDAATGNQLRRLTVLRSGARGVQLQNGSNGNRLDAIHSNDNGRTGIVMLSSDHNLVTHSTAARNTQTGIGIVVGAHNVIEDGDFSDNEVGVFLSEATDGTLESTVASRNSDEGIVLDTSDRNTVSHNRVSRNAGQVIVVGDRNVVAANLVLDAPACLEGCSIGISMEGGVANLVVGNVVSGAKRMGIRVDAFVPFGGVPTIGTVIRDNLVRDPGVDGIAVNTDPGGGGPVTGTVVQGNVVAGALEAGIHVASPATTIKRNLALRNGGLGIDAVPGVTDGGGNRAVLNGDPLQCVNVFCR